MESNSTPMIIQSEPIMPQNSSNVSQYFVEKSGQPYEQLNTFAIRFTLYNIFIYFFSIFALIGSIIPAIVVSSVKFYIRIAIISPGVIFTLILFAFGSNKIILIKDTSNKKLLVKLINYLYFTKMKFNLDIENTHFCMV